MTEHAPTTLHLREHPRFVTVVIGEGLSMMGDSAFDLALAWMVLHHTGSIAALSAVVLAHTVPRGLLLLLGGAVTDRVSSRTVMLSAHGVRCLAMTVLALLVWSGQSPMWSLYVVATLTGATGAMFTPASEAVLQDLVPAAALARANALQGLAEQASFLLGPMLGAALIAFGGPGMAITVNAVTFLVAACTARVVPTAPRTEAGVIAPGAAVSTDHEKDGPVSLVADIRAGLAHPWGSHATRLVLLIISAATLSYSGVFCVGLPVLARSWSSSPWALSALISAWGLGQLIGTASAAVTGLPRRWGRLIIGMTLVEGAAFALLGLSPCVWAAVAILVPLGIGVAHSADVALPTFIQSSTPEHLLGRVSAVLALPRVLLEPVSIAVLGAVLHHSITWGFALAALPVLVTGLYLLTDATARQLSSEHA